MTAFVTEATVRESDTLRTPRLLLRRFVLDDLDAMHAIFSDPEAMRYWSTLPHTQLSETREWLDETIAAVAADQCDDFAVTLDGTVIGKAGLWRSNEIGMIFARETWGTGVAREALRAVIERAVASGTDPIVAEVDPRNLRSLRCLQALGFVQTGSAQRTFCLGGVWSGSVYLARSSPG